MTNKKKKILITGSSSGIGYNAAKFFLKKNYTVVGISRTKPKIGNKYKKIDIEFSPRRMGDVPVLYTCPKKALKVLNWETKRSLNDMCEDTWRWLKNNPNGFNF